MENGLEPTEEYDGSVSVHVLDDDGDRERVRCESYEEAIETVRDEQTRSTVVKIEDRDGEVVFTSAEMDIDEWAREWEQAKRGLSVDVEERECPHGSVSCFPDDRCVQCTFDAMQANYRGWQ